MESGAATAVLQVCARPLLLCSSFPASQGFSSGPHCRFPALSRAASRSSPSQQSPLPRSRCTSHSLAAGIASECRIGLDVGKPARIWGSALSSGQRRCQGQHSTAGWGQSTEIGGGKKNCLKSGARCAALSSALFLFFQTGLLETLAICLKRLPPPPGLCEAAGAPCQQWD